jgi:hypothetical protein
MSHTSDPEKFRSAKLAVETLEDRTTPTFSGGTNPFGQQFAINGVTTPVGGGLSIAVGDVLPDPTDTATAATAEYVTGSGPGSVGVVRVFSNSGNQQLSAFVPFAGFTGGVNVAVGDVLGDGKLEIIAAVATNGPPHVKVFKPDGTLLSSFYAFSPGFLGGLNIAVGNVQGGIRAGGFPGGAVSSQFKQEIIIGAAAGNSPHVVVTDGSGNLLQSFFAFDASYLGGVVVAAASIDKTRIPGFVFGAGQSDTNAYDEIMVGAATKIPHLKVFSVWQGAPQLLQSYFAYDPSLGRGISITAGSTDNVPGAEIYVNLVGTSSIRAFDGLTGRLLGERPNVFPPNYTGVLNMATGYVTPTGNIPTTNGTIVIGGPYDPRDDDTRMTFGDFDFLDLAVVTGDGALFQVPRFFIGLNNSPAPFNGP